MTKVLPAALGLLGCIALAAQGGQPAQEPVVKFELRRAENRPAEGLIEAKIEGTNTKVYLRKEIGLTNKDVARAQAKVQPGQKPAVEVTFTEQGAKRLARLTKQHQGKPVAILVNGKVLAAPIARATITGGNAVITGDFTQAQAERIANGIQGK
jgi:preprotein translocase subunit SecD